MRSRAAAEPGRRASAPSQAEDRLDLLPDREADEEGEEDERPQERQEPDPGAPELLLVLDAGAAPGPRTRDRPPPLESVQGGLVVACSVRCRGGDGPRFFHNSSVAKAVDSDRVAAVAAMLDEEEDALDSF